MVDDITVGDEFVAAAGFVCCISCFFNVVVFDSKVVVGDEVVDDGHIMAACGEFLGNVAANKARAAGDEYFHGWM